MEFLIDNWYIVVVAVVGFALGFIYMRRFSQLPTDEQLDNVRQWLLGAVTEAEIALGGGTGALKLRQVYDLFVERFPWLAKIITFSMFSDMVDDALDEMRELLAKNEAVKDLVKHG